MAVAYLDFGDNYQRKNDLSADRPGPAVFTMPTGRAAYRLISHRCGHSTIVGAVFGSFVPLVVARGDEIRISLVPIPGPINF